MTALLWVMLVVLITLVGICGYVLVLLQGAKKSQDELQNDSTTNRASLDSLKAEIVHVKSGQAELQESVKGVETASQVAHGRLGELAMELSEFSNQQDILVAACKVQESQSLPVLMRSDFLTHVSFEEFFLPPEIVIYPEKLSSKERAWLSALLGSSAFGVQIFDSVKTLTERYGEFSEELTAKLATGAATIMESTEGARWVVVDSHGKIIGQGVMRAGATLAHGAASIFSSVTLAAYILVARDTHKQLKSMNAALTSLAEEAIWLRQSKLESTYEALRRVSQSGYAHDRGTVLHLIKELHELRSFLRRKILAENPNIQEPGKLKGFFRREQCEEERRKFFDTFRGELLQAHQIFRLEAFAVSLLNDPKMEAAFVRSVEEEAERLDVMHMAMENNWVGDREQREEEERPAILAEISELALLYNLGLAESRTVVIQQYEEVNA